MGRKTHGKRKVLAVDIGTSSIKGGIIDEEGNLIAWNKVRFESPSAGEYKNWDARRWIDAFTRLVSELGKGEVDSVSSLSISGNGPTLVPIDESGNPLSEALLWVDGRAYPKEGGRSFFLPKAAWLAEERPEVYERSSFLLGCPEFVAFQLTGEAAAFTPSQEFIPYIWDADELNLYGLTPEKFASPLRTGTIVGRVRSEVSNRLGLPDGLPVVAGGADFLMALIGTATVRPGRTCDRTGTSEGINCCSGERIVHPRIRTLPHAIEGNYNAAGILSSTGMIFEWFRRLTGQENRSYEEMLSEIREGEWRGGSEGRARFPFFFPSVHRGAVWEFAGGAFTGLEAQHGAAELGRAVVNSIGFGIRDLIETLEREGCLIETLRVSGGQGRNEVWNAMKADMTGKRVEVPRIIDGELAGGAVASFVALDGEPIAETAERIVHIEKTFEPDPNREEKYRIEYEEYERLCARMLPALSEEMKNHR